MGSSSKFKKMAIGVTVRLICMLLLGGLLVTTQTYLAKSGRVPLELNLNLITHLISVCVVGIIGGIVSKERNLVNTLIATAVLYGMLLLLGGVIFNGLGQGSIYGILGGLAGVAVTILVSLTQNKKRRKWNMKKYRS